MIRCALSAVGLAAVAVAVTILYYEGLHLPIVGQVVDGAIAHRLESYVLLSEKTAADALAAEQKRQADAANAALKTANNQIAIAKASEAEASAELETRIAFYEQQLAAAHRDCIADDADVDFIVQHGAGSISPVGHH